MMDKVNLGRSACSVSVSFYASVCAAAVVVVAVAVVGSIRLPSERALLRKRSPARAPCARG